jgi:hypothetical protein
MSCLETNNTKSQKLQMRLNAKDIEFKTIKSYLNNGIFRNEKLTNKTADFIQWMYHLVKNPNEYKYPNDLIFCLQALNRYENDLQLISEDVLRKFKTLRF